MIMVGVRVGRLDCNRLFEADGGLCRSVQRSQHKAAARQPRSAELRIRFCDGCLGGRAHRLYSAYECRGDILSAAPYPANASCPHNSVMPCSG